MCASLPLQPAPVVHSVGKWEILGNTLPVKRSGLLPIDSGLRPWSLDRVSQFLADTTQRRGKSPKVLNARGVTSDGTYLNWKLQNHIDDSFPTTGKVEPFRQPDPEAPQKTEQNQKGEERKI